MRVDVRKVLKEKNPRLARWVPEIFLQWLERIIHQKEINTFLEKYGDKSGIAFCDEVLKYFNVNTEVFFSEVIPTEGRYIFVSNHPLGGFDGIILMKLIHEKFGQVKVPVNDILMNIPQLNELFIPINKHGHQTRETAIEMDKVFQSQVPILTFPAGLCSRKINGKIIDLEWKKNFIVKAIESKRDIVPIYFEGKNSNFFYNLSNFRKNLGIKFNIEMIFLVNEMFRHRDQTFKIYFGRKIPISSIDKSKSNFDWAQLIKEIVYQIPETFVKK